MFTIEKEYGREAPQKPCFNNFIHLKSGRRKANVFPLPVLAIPIISLPLIQTKHRYGQVHYQGRCLQRSQDQEDQS